MTELYLTAYDGSILGPIAKVLGLIMNWIYNILSSVGISNIAVSIIVFTIVIYLCMFPLTYKQQKFSILQRKMQPEMKAIQDKYKDKKDQASMQAQQEETQMLYDKYGISPTGSCVQLLIQMPIFFALYRVFYNVPAYLNSVKDIFSGLVTDIMASDGYVSKMQAIYEEAQLRNVKVDFSSADTDAVGNYIVDVLYKLPVSGWDKLSESFPNISDSISSTYSKLEQINYLFILNISDTPWNQIKDGWATKSFGIIIIALLIPVLSYISQVLNIKLMPQSNDSNDQMAQQMKTMNTMMPLMSLFICFTVPVGLGIYWIAGAVVRFVQQYFLNKHFEKINLDDIIEANKEKAAKKKEKRGIRQAQIYGAATMNTKSNSMASKASINVDKQEALDRAEAARSKASSGSLASKANLVKDFNERNNK